MLGEVSPMMLESIVEALADSVKLFPFLFLTYLLMEYVEHKTENRTRRVLEVSGSMGPLLGGIVGVVPQCGISAAASNLYAGRMITLGTLLAVYLSTSDEMLPIMISNAVPGSLIFKTLVLKAGIGIVLGFLVDLVLRYGLNREREALKIHSMCEHDHCHCEDGIVKPALHHTLHIFVYIVLISLVLNLGIAVIGEENLAAFILNKPVLGPMLAGIIGLIPNCAASVIITQMFLDGLMSFGTMMAGLLVGAGVGILVLLRVNEDKKESVRIILLLYVLGVAAGVLLNLFGIK